MSELTEWDSYYLIVGGAAGALIGLQFVVMTLIAERPPSRAGDVAGAFLAPTIVHFGTVLFLSAMVRAPWHTITPIAVIWGLTGLCGTAYAAIVIRRMTRQTVYKPEMEDWVFHAMLPVIAYALLGLSALITPTYTREALFGVGSVALLLLFIGIHNSWDTVNYHVFVTRRETSSTANRKRR
jgi:hypothetical protein